MFIFSDKCDTNYCQHGGTCDKSIPSQPTCSCTGLWAGETCTERYGKQYLSPPNPNISVPRVRVISCKKSYTNQGQGPIYFSIRSITGVLYVRKYFRKAIDKNKFSVNLKGSYFLRGQCFVKC